MRVSEFTAFEHSRNKRFRCLICTASWMFVRQVFVWQVVIAEGLAIENLEKLLGGVTSGLSCEATLQLIKRKPHLGLVKFDACLARPAVCL